MTTTEMPTTQAMQALRRQLTGRVVSPVDPEWDAARRGWNLSVDQQPSLVVHAADVDDIVTTVRFAREQGTSVAAQPIGHAATRAVDGAILLRTGELRELTVGGETRTARVGPGVQWKLLNQALTGTGLSGLPGSSGDPTVVGYTLGGGMSWFGRKYGMAANRVRAVELVNPEGELMRVTAEDDAELFWAVRGGGGDFGIVTALEINLLPVEHVTGGRLVWPAEGADAMLAAFVELAATAPDELTMWPRLLKLPDQDDVPEPLRGRWTAELDLTYLGTAEQTERAIARLRDLPAPLVDTIGPVPLTELGTITAEPTDATPLVETTAFLTGFDHAATTALVDGVAAADSTPLTVVQVRHLEGAFTHPPTDGGAVSRLAEPYLLVAVAVTPTRELVVDATAGLQKLRAAIAGYDTGRRVMNYGDAAEVYPPDVLDRLRDIKRRRDPDGVIRSNRPVLPAESSP